MATLVSPGVSISVANETFYSASGPGTVPLVIFATAQDKLVPGSSSIVAEGTRKATAGKMYLMTSQRDVLQTFGVPVFQSKNGTVVQGDELSEYGLHALFSAMGVTNRAYALRADIDLNSLQPTSVMPKNEPLNQTMWFDVASSDFGVFEHNGGTSQNPILNWTKKNVLVPSLEQVSVSGAPKVEFPGNIGDYAFVPYYIDGTNTPSKSVKQTSADTNRLYKHNGSAWVRVATIAMKALTPPDATTGAVWVRLDNAAGGMNMAVKKYSSATHAWQTQTVYASPKLVEIEAKYRTPAIGSIGYQTDGTGGNFVIRNASNVPKLDILNITDTKYNKVPFQIVYVDGKSTAPAVAIYVAPTVSVQGFIDTVNNTGVLRAVPNGQTGVTVSSPRGTTFEVISGIEVMRPTPSNWEQLRYEADSSTPSRQAAEGTIWYDNSLYIDVMVNSGTRWRALRSPSINGFGFNSSSLAFFSQSEPSTKPDLTALAYGDIWVDPNDGTNFDFYIYQDNSWVKLDPIDQSTTNGILFADARSSTEAGINYFNTDTAKARDALLVSDYVDPDCPDPRLYPAGMVMVNLRQTGGVVRKYVADAFKTVNFFDGPDADADKFEYYVGDQLEYKINDNPTYAPLTLASIDGSRTGRWVTASGLASNGAGLFGRAAQRKVVVDALAATIVGNDELRAETVEFNLMTAPGYVDLLDELVTLNVDRKETAYIITDVPARLKPDATSINNWAKNVNNAPSNGEVGRTTRYDYAAQYMGWGLGTNADGAEVVVPGSTIALRTYLYSDSVSYVWFPPAGIERGIVTNAASIGYVNGEGEYAPVIYNQGQRDTMYLNNINPIALRPNRGLLVYGDKSLAADTTALDRVNVGRLVVYIRTEVAKIAERFIFKLNTPRVREEFAGALTAFLANIVQLEGLEDFLVVCDSSNNTPIRTQRNELWADIAIVPTKSINFVYVAVRLRNQVS